MIDGLRIVVGSYKGPVYGFRLYVDVRPDSIGARGKLELVEMGRW